MGMGEDPRQGDKEGLVIHSSLGRPGKHGCLDEREKGTDLRNLRGDQQICITICEQESWVR